MGKFGWSLPPGVSNRDIDEQAGVYDICEVCGAAVDDCLCHECPVCNEVGDVRCYKPIPPHRKPILKHLKDSKYGHGLKFSKTQQISLQKRVIMDLQAQMDDAAMVLAWLEAPDEETAWEALGELQRWEDYTEKLRKDGRRIKEG